MCYRLSPYHIIPPLFTELQTKLANLVLGLKSDPAELDALGGGDGGAQLPPPNGTLPTQAAPRAPGWGQESSPSGWGGAAGTPGGGGGWGTSPAGGGGTAWGGSSGSGASPSAGGGWGSNAASGGAWGAGGSSSGWGTSSPARNTTTGWSSPNPQTQSGWNV